MTHADKTDATVRVSLQRKSSFYAAMKLTKWPYHLAPAAKSARALQDLFLGQKKHACQR
jgi:hypothetical protein